MHGGKRIALIIPALNEEDALGPLLASVDRGVVDSIIVADNGSTDRTSEVAEAAGAQVVLERRRGYGSACLRALAEDESADIYVFLDGDGSDDPREIEGLLDHMSSSSADLIIGSRTMGHAEDGALTSVQAFGNALTCMLVRWFWDVRYTDLGPFRAVTRSALNKLEMSDPDFGWTIEMQVKAAQRGLRIMEIPVSRRLRQAGSSKVSGSLTGSFRAGVRILSYVFGAKWQEWMQRNG